MGRRPRPARLRVVGDPIRNGPRHGGDGSPGADPGVRAHSRPARPTRLRPELEQPFAPPYRRLARSDWERFAPSSLRRSPYPHEVRETLNSLSTAGSNAAPEPVVSACGVRWAIKEPIAAASRFGVSSAEDPPIRQRRAPAESAQDLVDVLDHVRPVLGLARQREPSSAGVEVSESGGGARTSPGPSPCYGWPGGVTGAPVGWPPPRAAGGLPGGPAGTPVG